MDPTEFGQNFDRQYIIFDEEPPEEFGMDKDKEDKDEEDEDVMSRPTKLFADKEEPRIQDEEMTTNEEDVKPNASEEPDVSNKEEEEDNKKMDQDHQDDDDDDEDDDEDEAKNGSDSEPGEDVGGIEFRPSYKKANQILFREVCTRLEFLDKYQREKNSVKRKLTKEDKLKHLLPPLLLKGLRRGSPFPWFRLLLAEKDTSRKTRTREKSLANAYAEVLGVKDQPKHGAMKHYTNPNTIAKAGYLETPPSGDLSIVVEYTVREVEDYPPSKATIGDINAALDRLVARLASNPRTSKGKSGKPESQQWQFSQQSQTQRRASQTQKGKNKTGQKQADVRKEFVDHLVNRLKLSPKEHKWVIRMMLSEGLKIGLGFEAILNWWNPHAENLWKSHNSLMAVCDNLCNPAYVKNLEKRLQKNEEERKKTSFSRLFAFDTNMDAVRIGCSLSAMKSERTSFEQCMTDMAKAHKGVLKQLAKDDPIKESLALKFPAFTAEIKLDGERMVVHVQRGKVTMHTRQGRWYSQLYSPIVGPALRRAIAKYDIDVILDGEILAWDNNQKRVIEFGNNRTVAILRQNWLYSRGEIDDRDRRLHEGEKDAYVMEFDEVKHWKFDTQKPVDPDSTEKGDQLWVKFVAFDVLFVGGPDAKKAIKESLRPNPPANIGSVAVADMSGFERKRILYHLVEVQKNEVEIVETAVIRPNGDCAKGEDYFSSSDPTMDPDCDIPAHTLDSAKWTLNEGHPDLPEIDKTRRKDRNDSEISQRRTAYVNNFYHSIVDEKKLEGLVFKELSAPYILRNKTGLWRKIKPDYASASSEARDIDALIIGASYGVGTKRGGQVASFLCACPDSKEPGKWMPFVRLNAKSLDEKRLDVLMAQTGFIKGKDGSLGHWFTMEEEREEAVPDFISQRSLQFEQENYDGWKFDRAKIYPNLFIRPEHAQSVVVNAAEIVTSDEYSAGVTLRFPRIHRDRVQDPKDLEEFEDEAQLHQRLEKFKSQMESYARTNTFDFASPSKKPKRSGEEDSEVPGGQICMFLTAEQYERKQKQAKKRVKKHGVVKHVRIMKQKSNALQGFKFHVLEGSYKFEEGNEAEQARAEGWLDDATQVYSASDVATYIMMHGGQVLRTSGLDVFVVGASCDMKVTGLIKALDNEREKKEKKRKKDEVVEDASTTTTTVPGVLKWTYVFSLVQRWQNEKNRRLKEDDGYSEGEEEEGDFEQNDESILSTLPEMLQPRFFDFLAQSPKYGDEPLQSIWRYGPLDTTTMKQALSLVQDVEEADQRKAKKPKSEMELVPWQKSALDCLPPENRWILSCQYEKLWPHGSGSAEQAAFGPASADEKQPVIVYPDLFGDDFGCRDNDDADARWEKAPANMQSSAMASSLPLLRCMGSRITYHLNESVTHVLCNLRNNKDSIAWYPGDVLDVFHTNRHGRLLQERLEDSVGHSVLLITSAWVNATFEEGTN